MTAPVTWRSAPLLWRGAGSKQTCRIRLEAGRVRQVEEAVAVSPEYLLLPELTNAHDHLEFNLYGGLGRPPYEDFHAWGRDVHLQQKELVQQVESIPLGQRQSAGLLKNLLNGFTAVVDHGPHTAAVQKEFPLTVIQDFRYIHAPGTHRGWRKSLLNPFDRNHVMVHLGEGLSERVYREAQSFFRWNLLRKPVIAVHGLNLPACDLFGFVWCPGSNQWLYHESARLPANLPQGGLLLGTDSTASGSANAWEHLRLARELNYCPDEQLYESVAENPARYWSRKEEGTAEGQNASFVIARRHQDGFYDSFFSLNPKDIMLVVKQGQCLLCDDGFKPEVLTAGEGWYPVPLDEAVKWIRFDVEAWKSQVAAQAPLAHVPLLD